MNDQKLVQLIIKDPDRGMHEAMRLYGKAVNTIVRSILKEHGQELTLNEVQMLEELIENESAVINESWDDTYIRQQQLIYPKMHSEDAPKRTVQRKSKKFFVVLVAAVVMLLGTVSFAMEKYDLDIHMAETLGLSCVMPLLPDGTLYIGVSDTDAGVTLTATEAVGDKFNQWIKIETNIPWKERNTILITHGIMHTEKIMWSKAAEMFFIAIKMKKWLHLYLISCNMIRLINQKFS